MAQIKLTVVSDTKNAETSIKNLKTEIAALAKEYEKVSAFSKKANPVNDIGAVAKSTAANIETLRKSYSNLITQLKTLKGQYDNGIFDKVSASVEQNQKQIVNLSKAYQQNGKLTEQQQAVARQLSNDYKKLSADIAQLKAENDKLRVSDPFSTNISDNVSRLQKRYQALLGTIQSISKYYPKGTFDSLTQSIQADVAQLNSLDKTAASSLPTLNKLNSSILQQEAAFAQARNSATNYHGTLRDLVSGFLKFQVAAMLVMKPLQLIQSAISSINETLVETEKVVVSLQRVLDETVASGEISSELYAIAENLGQTFDNVQEIAQNFAKAGLSWQDTLKATEAAVLALNVAELTAEESSEGLIAVMQQFNYEASELTYVIDVLNKAADKSAVDTADLLVALQKTGSYASAANLSLEETVGLISALSEATAASGQNIGNALKSLFAYSSKASSLEVFASLSDEMKDIVDMYQIGNASILDVWEELADTMTNLSDAQADLLEQWSSESGLETELGAELGDVYEQMSGVWDTAGVYRKNYFIALLNNFDEVKEVMGEISDASGYTAEEQAKYMDTYEAKLNALQAQWQELANDEQGWLSFKKGLLDIASGLLTVIEYTGGLRTIVLAVGTALTFAFGEKVINSIVSFGKNIKSLITTFKSAQSAAVSFSSALTSIIGIAGIVGTVFSAVVGNITQAIDEANKKAEEARQTAINAWGSIADSAKELSDLYQQYLELSQITDKTAEQQDEWATIQENIVGLLGEQAIQLGGLTEGTEAYRQKLIELTQTELEYYAMRAQAASNAYEEEFNALSFDTDFGNQVLGHIYKIDRRSGLMFEKGDYDLYEALLAAGYDIGLRAEHDGANPYGDMYFDAKLDDLSVYEQADKLFKMAEYLFNNGGGDSDLYDAIFSAYEERLEAINKRISTEASEAVYGYIAKNGFVDTQIEFDEIVNRIMEATGASEEWRDEIEGLVSDYSGFNEKVEETNDDLDDQIKKISTLEDESIDKLIDDLQEIRDLEDEAAELEEKRLDVAEAREAVAEAEAEAAEKLAEAQQELADAQENLNEERLNLLEKQKEATEALVEAQEKLSEATENINSERLSLLEEQKNLQEELADQQEAAEERRLDLLEKQQAVLEAQKALEEARNNRSVWRYNDATGQWDWVTDESAVKDAEEELASAEEAEKEAQEAYDEALQSVEDAKAELEDINLTIQDAEKAIEEAIAKGYDIPKEIWEEEKNIATGVRDAIQNFIEAQQNVSDAEDEVANYEEAIAQAEQAIKEAIEQGLDISAEITESNETLAQGVIDAITAVKDAQQAIKDQEKENEETIASAQENLQEAIDAFNEYIEDQAWDDVISELESGNATNDSIKEILDNWKATSETQAEADTEWYQKIIDAIKDSVDVDITLSEDTVEDSNSYINKANELNTAFQQYSATWGSPNLIANRKVEQLVSAVTNSANSPEETEQAYRALLDYLNENYSDWDKLANYTYDSGGIASGAGYLAKATAEPETVNDPELTAKILSPVSNAQFDRYVRDMGILFEAAREYAISKPVMQSAVGNSTTTNNNSNNSYSINGVKIGSDMLNRPFGEVLQMMTMVPFKS